MLHNKFGASGCLFWHLRKIVVSVFSSIWLWMNGMKWGEIFVLLLLLYWWIMSSVDACWTTGTTILLLLLFLWVFCSCCCRWNVWLIYN
jgi:hypothetical protein